MDLFLDKTDRFSPQYNENGLIPAIAVDHASGEVLMMAWMNAEALKTTLDSGEAHYWSRSRQALWHKGATSGHHQIIKDIYVDCDQDTILLSVEQLGEKACHTGRYSCFYRKLDDANPGKLIIDEKD